MAAADIGANASNYQGNAGLGGGTFGSFQLDTKPIEDLAKYTMLYNKSEYDQRQKDVEKAADEIADMTSYDLTTGIPKDAKILQDKYDKMVAFATDKENPLSYRNRERWAEYKKMRNDLDNDLKGAKVRNTMWALRQKEIQDAKTPAEKARLQGLLDKEINDSDIRTPLKYSEQFDIQPVEVSAASRKKVSVTEIGKNFFGTDSWDMPDMDAVVSQALTINSGLLQLTDFENTDSFKAKTPQEQDLIRKQFQAQSASGKLEPIESSKHFNSALTSLLASTGNTYKDANGNIDYQKIIDDGKDPLGVLQQAMIYNKKMDEMVGYIDQRMFIDDFGKELHFGNDASGLKKSSYAKINLNDGISPDELLKIRILAASPAASRVVKVDQTDLGIKKGQLGIGWYNAKTARINANKPSDGPTPAASGITTPAILFGEHINRVKEWYSKNPTGGDMAVDYTALDEKTRGALKIETGQRVVYRQDGNFVIQTGTDTDGWTDARVGTIEDLKQGFINIVKGGMGGDGTQTKEFQDESEKGFNQIFGTTSGSMIFKGWGKPATTETQTDPDAGLTDAQYFLKYKKARSK